MMYLLKSNEELTQQYQAIMGRTLVDSAFRERLLANPQRVITTETNVVPEAVDGLVTQLKQLNLDVWKNGFPTIDKQLQNGWW